VHLLSDSEIVKSQKKLFNEMLHIYKPQIIVCVYKNVWDQFKLIYETELAAEERLTKECSVGYFTFCWQKKPVRIFVVSDLPGSRNRLDLRKFRALCNKIKGVCLRS
jgi:hypothetical protein